jgi:hypothetical protein
VLIRLGEIYNFVEEEKLLATSEATGIKEEIKVGYGKISELLEEYLNN